MSNFTRTLTLLFILAWFGLFRARPQTAIKNTGSETSTKEIVRSPREDADEDEVGNNVVQIPQFDGSGVVLLFHIPKTGGTTVRKMFRPGDDHWRCPDVCYYPKNSFTRPQSQETWDELVTPRVENILNGTQKKELYVIEYHGWQGRTLGLADLQPYISHWRQLSVQSGVPFFPFILVREPAAFYISYFLFFHNSKCKYYWCEPDTYKDLSEKNLIKSAHSDQQAKFLMNIPKNGTTFTDQDMTQLQGLLQDWALFTTEDLSSTIHILSERILNMPFKGAEVTNTGKLKRKTKLTSKSLSKKARTALDAISQHDKALHQIVQQKQKQQQQGQQQQQQQQQATHTIAAE